MKDLVSSLCLFGSLFAVSLANPTHGNDAADVNLIKQKIADPTFFCNFYLSERRTRTVLKELNQQRLSTACRCLLTDEKLPIPHVSPYDITANNEWLKCNRRHAATIQDQFVEALGFCKFYTARSRSSNSPIFGLSSVEVMEGCMCIEKAASVPKKKKTTTTAMMSTTATTEAGLTTTTSLTTANTTTTTSTTTSTTAGPCSYTAPTTVQFAVEDVYTANFTLIFNAPYTTANVSYNSVLTFPGNVSDNDAITSCISVIGYEQDMVQTNFDLTRIEDGMGNSSFWRCAYYEQPKANNGSTSRPDDLYNSPANSSVLCSFGYLETAFDGYYDDWTCDIEGCTEH
ncbi:hypothetical protein ANO11243_027320 [Dothideomycetidae sp. 11243]|nr:hypothetical protein ANO11243_027320 [fungal sp. No.11243]